MCATGIACKVRWQEVERYSAAEARIFGGEYDTHVALADLALHAAMRNETLRKRWLGKRQNHHFRQLDLLALR